MFEAILIAGPTASGKSALAIALAERFGGVVINADSMQVYRDLRIITARPTDEEERRVPHLLFGHVDAAINYSAGQWIADARAAALAFFHQPLEQKLKSAPKESVRGFNAIGKTKMHGAASPDHKEYFQIGLELPRDDPAVLAGQPLRGPNQWPRP